MLQIYLFGTVEIDIGTGEVTSLSTQKVTELLAYLWLRRDHPQPRSQVAGLLWPETDEQRARQSLRTALHQLRQVLEPDDASQGTYLLADRETVRFNPEADCWVDVGAFLDRLEQAKTATGEARLRCLQEAVSLYRGDLLEGCYEDWCLEERDQLKDRYLNALEALVAVYTGRAEPRSAIAYTKQLLKAKPLEEAIHRQLMYLYTINGWHDTALDQYRQCRQLLDEELNTEPLQETEELAEKIEAEVDAEELAAFAPLVEKAGLHNLPSSPTRFIGREHDIHQLKQRLSKYRLLTLTGVGGSGKTRLALELAWRLVEAYDEGVWWVDLAPLTDSNTVPHAVASALGVREQPGQSLTETLADALQTKHLLLVLDNAEHLIETAAGLIGRLLETCSQLTVLATSREVLRVPGEAVWEVPPLASPDPSTHQPPEKLTEHEAIQLFVDRAQTSDPDFRLSTDNGVSVAQICHQLEGVPLALELAAARVRTISVRDIAERLGDRFRLLETESRGTAPRHRTLEAALEWSWTLLEESEQKLLRRLAVFRGGWTLEAAEAVCAGNGVADSDVLDLLAGLADKSLVEVDKQRGHARYRLLETVRQYGEAKRETEHETASIKQRHLTFFRKLAEEAESKLVAGEQAAWLQQLETEHDNLRTALAWALEAGEVQEAFRLGGALEPFWNTRGYLSEGRSWLAQALQQEQARSKPRAKALCRLGHLAHEQADHAVARNCVEEGLSIARERGAQELEAKALYHLGRVAEREGDLHEARRHHQESLAISENVDDMEGMAENLSELGWIANRKGNLNTARYKLQESINIYRNLDSKTDLANVLNRLAVVEYNLGNDRLSQGTYQECLAIYRSLGANAGIANVLNNLGIVTYRQGQQQKARERFEESLALFRMLGKKVGIAATMYNLAGVAQAQGRMAEARERCETSLSIACELGDQHGIAANLSGLASVMEAEERPVSASQLQGAVTAILARFGAVLDREDLERYGQTEAALKADIGVEKYEKAFHMGQSLSVEDAIALATSSDAGEA